MSAWLDGLKNAPEYRRAIPACGEHMHPIGRQIAADEAPGVLYVWWMDARFEWQENKGTKRQREEAARRFYRLDAMRTLLRP